MNWNKQETLAAIQAAQKAKFEKVRKLLFGDRPVPPLKRKPKKPTKDPRWTCTETLDCYGNTKWTYRRVYSLEVKQAKDSLPEKKNPLERYFLYEAFLKKRGFKYLGSGAFSTVWAKPDSDRVIKVTRRPDNWIDYCMWGAKHGYAGTLSPMVYSYKKYNGFCVSVVERMDRTFSDFKQKEDLYMASSLLRAYERQGNTMAGLLLEEIVPGLADFSMTLKKTFGSLDLHGGNIMVRKDGSVCVTDPVTDIEGSQVTPQTYTRLKARDFGTASFGSPTSLVKVLDLIYYLRYKQWYENSNRHRSQCFT